MAEYGKGIIGLQLTLGMIARKETDSLPMTIARVRGWRFESINLGQTPVDLSGLNW